MYTHEDLGFILYNNRSVNGTVMNFIKERHLDIPALIEIEDQLEWCKIPFEQDRIVTISVDDLDQSAPDIIVTQKDVTSLAPLLIRAHEYLIESDNTEREWLTCRGINTGLIKAWRLGSLAFISEDKVALEKLGVTRHPLLSKIIKDDISEGGILIPLWRGDELVNCTTRRISDVGKLKYSQACPDVDVWGLDLISRTDHVWMVEGLLDMMAIENGGRRAVSVSGAMWSGPQLIQLLDAATDIDIFADNDQVGLRCAAILKRFLRMQGLRTKTFISKKAKDPAEHFLEMGLGWDDVEEVLITRDMLDSMEPMEFNFVKYLKNRRF